MSDTRFNSKEDMFGSVRAKSFKLVEKLRANPNIGRHRNRQNERHSLTAPKSPDSDFP